jgi:predicted O-methyltransferase YrrM
MPRRTLRDSYSAARHELFIWRHGLGGAEQIATHLTGEEKRELFHLVRRLRPRVIVEIGSYLGASS